MPTKLEQRVTAGSAARDAIDFYSDSLPEDEGHFWYTLANLAAARCGHVLAPDGPTTSPMSEAEAVKFERQMLPWGMHEGKAVGDAPASYLAAIMDNKFSKQVARYVRSSHFKRRLEEEC